MDSLPRDWKKSLRLLNQGDISEANAHSYPRTFLFNNPAYVEIVTAKGVTGLLSAGKFVESIRRS
jgi:hypothetical protein